MQRRSFIKTCALAVGAMAVNPNLALAGTMTPQLYSRVQLLDGKGVPLKASTIKPGQQLIFNYPYQVTPCFLINLGQKAPGRNGLRTESGESYDWEGGVGPQQTLVAFSAICAHKMTHPTPAVTHIAFRPRRSEQEPEAGVITCCSENSRYDPLRGAEVLSGPARQPLAAIMLEYDPKDDGLYALGTLGGEMFQRFFSEFERRLEVQYPNGDAGQLVSGQATATPLEEYSANIMGC